MEPHASGRDADHGDRLAFRVILDAANRELRSLRGVAFGAEFCASQHFWWHPSLRCLGSLLRLHTHKPKLFTNVRFEQNAYEMAGIRLSPVSRSQDERHNKAGHPLVGFDWDSWLVPHSEGAASNPL